MYNSKVFISKSFVWDQARCLKSRVVFLMLLSSDVDRNMDSEKQQSLPDVVQISWDVE